jgi:hypothetical protein
MKDGVSVKTGQTGDAKAAQQLHEGQTKRIMDYDLKVEK